MTTLHLDSPRALTHHWADAEARYYQGRYSGTGNLDELDLATGDLPVLFTAPHAVRHPRNGTPKPPDMFTGGLAMTLASALDAHALVACGPPTRDGNYDQDGAFKDELHRRLPHVDAVIDLHGMKDTWDVDVCLGRGAVPELAAQLVDVLRQHLEAAGFRVGVDAPFTGSHESTVTTSAQNSGTAAVQVEIARSARDFGADAARANALATAIAGAVIEYSARAA